MILADMGADVWKVEPPAGDDSRGLVPPVGAMHQPLAFRDGCRPGIAKGFLAEVDTDPRNFAGETALRCF